MQNNNRTVTERTLAFVEHWIRSDKLVVRALDNAELGSLVFEGTQRERERRELRIDLFEDKSTNNTKHKFSSTTRLPTH